MALNYFATCAAGDGMHMLSCYCQTGLEDNQLRLLLPLSVLVHFVWCGLSHVVVETHAHRYRRLHARYRPPTTTTTAFSLPLWDIQTHTLREGQCVSRGSCGVQCTEERRREEQSVRLYHASAGRKTEVLSLSLSLESGSSTIAWTVFSSSTR
ncbi:hypothetical protein Q8A73_011789 [Channa argus]|nr:hypothetical protein Q8A73_011789 [Channa argus]